MTTTPETIISFLRENPEFLTQHPELLPLQSGNVVNFQQAMVHKLRSDKERSEDRQRMMIDNARANMTIQARVQAAVLRTIEAKNFEDLLEIISNEVSLMLQVDVVSVTFEQPAVANSVNFPPTIALLKPGTLDALLGANEALVQANIDGDPRVFGPAARLVKSQALIRLQVAKDLPQGLLAFGSRDPLLFADGQGTELAGFLASVVERVVRRFIQ